MSTEKLVRLVYHPDLLQYEFGPHHPLRPERISAGIDLLNNAGLWDAAAERLTPVPASDEELDLVHDPAYVRTVRRAGDEHLDAHERERFGLGSSDNPPFVNMHYAASLVAGGSVQAARLLMSGELQHTFHPSGGLHHALRARASGFCIYNDPALAAAVAVKEFGARVAYIDFDCHHGDGVQWLFYRDPRVLTISFHESGRWLFPGTGDVEETGDGPGAGFTVNVPFAPFTQDDSWIQAMETVVPDLVSRFQPDLIISSHGADTHDWDPLTHLSLSTRSFVAQARVMHALAHQLCGGRWLAVGSGGYDWRRVVPRSWAIVWCEMTDRVLPDNLPDSWTDAWKDMAQEPLPRTMLDQPDTVRVTARNTEIEELNRASVGAALRLARQGALRW